MHALRLPHGKALAARLWCVVHEVFNQGVGAIDSHAPLIVGQGRGRVAHLVSLSFAVRFVAVIAIAERVPERKVVTHLMHPSQAKLTTSLECAYVTRNVVQAYYPISAVTRRPEVSKPLNAPASVVTVDFGDDIVVDVFGRAPTTDFALELCLVGTAARSVTDTVQYIILIGAIVRPSDAVGGVVVWIARRHAELNLAVCELFIENIDLRHDLLVGDVVFFTSPSVYNVEHNG